MIRRSLAAATVLLAVVLGSLALSSPAGAAPYPPTNPPSVSLSAYDPCAGASNVIGGTGFQAGEVVEVSLGDFGVLGRPTADANGVFSITVTIPIDARGNEVVTAVGETSGRSASVGLDVPCVLGQSSTEIDNGGGLAYTGVAIGGVLLAAALLIGTGAALLVASRRRRTGSAAV